MQCVKRPPSPPSPHSPIPQYPFQVHNKKIKFIMCQVFEKISALEMPKFKEIQKEGKK